MRIILILIFIFFFNFSHGQARKVITEKFAGNSVAARGEVLKCPGFNERYPCYNSACRKVGKWTYYYQNGTLKRIENYKDIRHCNEVEIPDGAWQYFNDKGILIKEEEYRNGILWTADIAACYFNNELAGQIQVKNGIRDTLEYVKRDDKNLVKNGDFKYYYGPPQFQLKDGQNQIEKQIPFWFSMDSNTPDYYNQYRGLKKVPDNQGHESNSYYDCVGIILYHEPTGNYSEHITGEFLSRLIPSCRYCLKIRLRLSRNSGFYIDKLGVRFSDSVSALSDLISNSEGFPRIDFIKALDKIDEWDTLTATFIATGRERYLTIGSFSTLSGTSVTKINPVSISEGDFNKSAYYLIDKIQVLKDTIDCFMDEDKTEGKTIDRISFDQINPGDSLVSNSQKIYVLRNIVFDFESSALLPSSLNELNKLFTFLEQNEVFILIIGHTDNAGTEEFNKTLSLARAKAVSDWLVNKGIDHKRIQIEGYGAQMPIVKNDSEKNRAINRRVEFKIK
jgi:OmpA-OmpF porin, OOP family